MNDNRRAAVLARWGTKTREQRFWEKVSMSSKGKCWLWKGTRNQAGYGIFFDGTRKVRAHRYSWELKNGKIPQGLEGCHTCDNPPCVNPDHVFVATHKENGLDAQRKHRTKQGERHWNCKLTKKQVLEIRKRFKPRKHGHAKALAKEFGINHNHVGRIGRLESWKHL